jgi:hypothetical protein
MQSIWFRSFVALFLLGTAPRLAQAQRPVPAAVVRAPARTEHSGFSWAAPELTRFVVDSAKPPRFLPIGTVVGAIVGGVYGQWLVNGCSIEFHPECRDVARHVPLTGVAVMGSSGLLVDLAVWQERKTKRAAKPPGLLPIGTAAGVAVGGTLGMLIDVALACETSPCSQSTRVPLAGAAMVGAAGAVVDLLVWQGRKWNYRNKPQP